MQLGSARFWLLGTVILAAGLPPLLIRGEQQTRIQRERHQQEIAALAANDRDHVLQNFKEYQQLSEADRTALADFHQVVTGESEESQELSHTLDAYLRWVKTLPPYQRDELMQETNPQARLVLMNDFLKKQEEQSLQRLLERELPWLPAKMREQHSRVPKLTLEHMEELVNVVLENARPHLSPSEIENISQVDGPRQLYELLQTLRDKGVTLWSDESLFTVMFTKIKGSLENEIRRDFEGRPESRIPSEGQRLACMVVLTASLIREFQREQERSANPSDEDLTKILDELSAEEQDRLLSLDATEFRAELTQQFEQQQRLVKVEDVFRTLAPPEPFRQRLQDFGPGGRNRPPFGPPPPGGDNREPSETGEPRRRFPNSPPPRDGFGGGPPDRPRGFPGATNRQPNPDQRMPDNDGPPPGFPRPDGPPPGGNEIFDPPSSKEPS